MYTETDYLNYTDLNSVETKIKELYTYYNKTYTPKTWQINEFVIVYNINYIEEAIDKMAGYFGYPEGYIKKRKWNLQGTNNISYEDINRWLKNIKFLRESEFNSLVPSNILKPSNTLVPSNKLI